VRAVANAGITPCYAVLTGLIVSGGQRLQAGRQGCVALARGNCRIVDPRDSIVTRFRNGEPLPGFSLPKNKNWDPRAEAMMRALEASLGDDAEFKRLRRATDTALDIAGSGRTSFCQRPLSVGDWVLKGQELIVASLGRIAGWICPRNGAVSRPRADTSAGQLHWSTAGLRPKPQTALRASGQAPRLSVAR